MGSETNNIPAGHPTSGELDRMILAPAVGLAALVVFLCAAVSFRMPLHAVVVPAQCLCVLSILGAAWYWQRSRAAWPLLGGILLALLAGWLALVDYAGAWFPDGADVLGAHPDNWAFQAFADYFDHYRRGRVDGMPMVDEFGAHFANARFAASALLAFLHHLPLLSDEPTARLVFALVCLSVQFLSVAAFCRVCVGYADWLGPLLAASLATAGGWLSRVLLSANDDNLIFVSLAPAFIALCSVSTSAVGTPARGRLVAIGILFGAMIYNYPEGMALLAVLCLPIAGEILWKAVTSRFSHSVEPLLGGLLGVVLALPYLSTFVSFLRHQIDYGSNVGSRPGEGSLDGLLGGNRLAGAFALGDELPGAPRWFAGNLVAVLLLLLVALGAWQIGRRLRWFPWVALPLVALCGWQNVAKQYDYGTFKILLMAGWWTYSALAIGFVWGISQLRLPSHWRVALAAGLLFGVCAVKYVHRRSLAPVEMSARFEALKELKTLRFVTGQVPVMLTLDDGLDYMWATYYLRDLPLGTRQQKGYFTMPHIAPYLQHGLIAAPETCKFLLVVGERPDALWKNSRFSLVRAAPVYIHDVQNPVNGLETLDGQRFLWVGTQPATFQIFAARAGHYRLSASRLILGPKQGGGSGITLNITDADGSHTVHVAEGDTLLPLALAAGENEVVLRSLDVPATPVPGGDPRELLLGISGPGVVPAEDTPP